MCPLLGLQTRKQNQRLRRNKNVYILSESTVFSYLWEDRRKGCTFAITFNAARVDFSREKLCGKEDAKRWNGPESRDIVNRVNRNEINLNEKKSSKKLEDSNYVKYKSHRDRKHVRVLRAAEEWKRGELGFLHDVMRIFQNQVVIFAQVYE